MEEKYVNDFGDSTQLISAKTALNKLNEIEILIDVIATRLVECRKLRLDEITSDEIKILERKLFKHFTQQLDAKQRVHPKDFLSDLHQYPSLPNLLTLAGVSSSFASAMKRQRYSVEELMNLKEMKLDYAVKDLGGNANDIEKLFSALSVLRKSSSGESSSDFSRNGSESSGSTGSDAFGPLGKITFDFSNTPEIKSRRQHSTEIPSTSSSTTPPSPTCGSHSSADSDSAFAIGRNQSSPPPVSLNIIPSTPSYSCTVPSTPITPSTPKKFGHQLLHPSFNDFPYSSKNISRDRFPSTGAKTTLSTSTAKLKASKSTEFNVGSLRENASLGFGNMSGSSQSLASNVSHPSPSITKQSKAHKKRNKRPNLTLDTDKLDFISLSRNTATRRGSSTISPEGSESPSPFSVRSSSVPLTPDSLGAGHHSFPGTPKTPKSFKAMRKIFKNFIGIKKMKRNKSSENLADPESKLPPVQRKRSGTMPSPKTNLLLVNDQTLPYSNPTSVYYCTPLASPEMNMTFANNEFNSSSRRTSLVDTDKTLVPDDVAEELKEAEPGGGEAEDPGSSHPDDQASSLFRQGSATKP